MSKAVNDILLIKKYLAGELDARAMHDLERRALDDPFLADALEGYEHARGDQQKNLDELSARITDRTDRKVRILTPRIQLSIAASLLVIIGIGVWLVIRNQRASRQDLNQVAVNVQSAPKPEQPTLSAPSLPAPQEKDTIVKEKKNVPARVTTATAVTSSQENNETQPPVLHELVVKKDSAYAANNPVKNPPVVAADKSDIGTADSKSVNGYNSIAANKVVVPQLKPGTNANDIVVQYKSALKKQPRPMVPETLLSTHDDNLNVQPAMRGGYSTLVGHVTGNNQPVVGAVVKLSGADFGVVTDVNGRFVMHNVPENKSLEVKSLGYSSKQVKLNGRDSITVSLEPNVSALAEVVTVAKPVMNSNDDKSSGSTGVRPRDGWKALNSYLDKNAVSPDGKAGATVLTFTVNGRGGLSGFTIAQSLSSAADQKAIDLISNGPAWVGNSDGQPHDVKITVNFHQ